VWIGALLLQRRKTLTQARSWTRSPGNMPAMRNRLPQTEETSVTIAALLAFCALVCGLFGFGFYKLMQPVQFPNPGLAAYRTFTQNQPATLLSSTNESLSDHSYETTGRAIQGEPGPQTVEQTYPVALTPAPLEKPTAKRAVAARPNSTATRKRAPG